MSFVRDQCAIMGQLQIELARQFVSMPKPTREELEEMLTICVYMGGGPALMYSAEALKAWDTLA